MHKAKNVSVAAILFLGLNLLFAIEVAKGQGQASQERHQPTYSIQNLPQSGMNIWVPTGKFAASSLLKVPRFPAEIHGNFADQNLTLTTVRNEQASAQLAVAATTPVEGLKAVVSDLKNDEGDIISSGNVQIRYVGYVPVEKSINGSAIEPVAGRAISGNEGLGVVADPLLERSTIDVPAHHAQPIWFTFHIPEDTEPGMYHGEIAIQSQNYSTVTYNIQLKVQDVVVPDPQNYQFHLDIWMNPNAIAAVYDVELWSEAHWKLLQAYFKDLASMGQSTVTTTIIQNPWLVEWNDWKSQTAIGYDTMVQWKYDGKNWTFDYSIFDRYVQTGLQAGVGPAITAYSLLVFRGPQRITYLDEQTGKIVTKKMKVGASFWKEAWTAFLQDFSTHLEKKGWLKQTYLAFDERPADIVSQVIELLKHAAPEFLDQTQMAGSRHVSPYAQNLSLNLDDLKVISDEEIEQRRKNGKTTTFYTWAGDHHPNMLSFSPAIESRLIPWISASRNLDGYLRWAYNSWPKNVFENTVYAFTQGDEYLVYPGNDGAMSSIRWELLKEGIEDYELIQIARQQEVNSQALKKALHLATQQWDGRKVDVHTLIRARHIVVEHIIAANN